MKIPFAQSSVVVFLISLLFLCCFTADASLSQRRAHSHRSKRLAIRGSKDKAAGILLHQHGELAGKDEAEDQQGDSDDQDDDDDDDEDEDAAPAAAATEPGLDKSNDKKARAPAKKATTPKPKAVNTHAAEEARLKKEVSGAEKALAANLAEQSELKMKIKFLKDEPKSDAEIDAASKLVANETDSVAMATMLGKMWKEMRMFEVPSFTRDVQEDIRHLKHEEKKLEEELDAAQAKLSTARSMWAKGGKAQEEEKEDVKKEAALKKKAAIKDDEKDDEDAVPAKIEKSSKASAPKPNKNVEKAVDTSLEASVLHRWSFWHMDSKQQHAVLTSSLVYLVFGVLIAFVYLQCRNKYASSSFFKPKPQRSIIGDKKEFSAPLFGCLGDPSICLVGLLCPCIRWADTIQQTKLSSYWKAFFIMFFLMLLHPYTLACSSICIFIIGAHYRQKLREKYGIEHGSKWSMFTDLAAWMCCQCCAIVQEAREEAFSKDKDIDGQSMA